MDAVTQLQNYLLSITSFMSSSMQHAWQGAGAVSIEQHKQAVQQEHADAQAQEATTKAAATTAAAAALPTIPEAGAAAAAAGSDGAAAGAPALLIPSLSAPLYSGLHPSVEHAMADRAHVIFKRVLEADALIQALPPLHAAPHDMKSQVEQVQFLEAHNEKAGQELKEAQEEAALWQQRVAYVLQQAAACQLRTNTNQAPISTTK